MTHQVDYEGGPRDRQRLEPAALRQAFGRTKRAGFPQRWHRKSVPTVRGPVPADSKCGSRSEVAQEGHARNRCAHVRPTLIAHGPAT
jgi:hypothetical protein